LQWRKCAAAKRRVPQESEFSLRKKIVLSKDHQLTRGKGLTTGRRRRDARTQRVAWEEGQTVGKSLNMKERSRIVGRMKQKGGGKIREEDPS